MRKRIIARCYIDDCKPNFELPMDILPNLQLVETKSVEPLHKKSKEFHGSYDFCLDLSDFEERNAIGLFHSIITGIRLASDCSIVIAGYDLLTTRLLQTGDKETFPWGHYDENLTIDPVHFVKKVFPILQEFGMPEYYNRFSNALRLYNESLMTRNCDLAMLGFISSLESLFSAYHQELTFRLSLLTAKFLKNSPVSQMEQYQEIKRIYNIRSKLSHGAKIEKNEESAAIQMVEYWTPKAEDLVRKCIKIIVNDNLVDIFLSDKLLVKFLEQLLFSSHRKEALEELDTH